MLTAQLEAEIEQDDYCYGEHNQIYAVDDFSFAAKDTADAANPKVQAWEKLMGSTRSLSSCEARRECLLEKFFDPHRVD